MSPSFATVVAVSFARGRVAVERREDNGNYYYHDAGARRRKVSQERAVALAGDLDFACNESQATLIEIDDAALAVLGYKP